MIGVSLSLIFLGSDIQRSACADPAPVALDLLPVFQRSVDIPDRWPHVQ